MSHTKGELKTGNTTDHNIMLVCGKNGKYVCSVRVKQTGGGAIAEAMESERIANAERLVLCWNSHDALLAACELAFNLHYPNPDDPDEIERLLPLDKRCKKMLKAAIKLCK